MRIDSHHHLWRYDPAEYAWIDADMAALRRDFSPEDLRQETEACGIEGVVSVQARQSLEETSWLLELAGGCDLIKGVVGWLPLGSSAIGATLERFAAEPMLKGLRHVVQGEPDGFLRREDFNAGIDAMLPSGLTYDLLIFERQLPQAIEFVDRHPAQVFVLDHVGKPRIKVGAHDTWARHLRELARRENVFCKISGMVTEADRATWSEEQLKPYLTTVLECFGAERVMFGSDWPVCLVACGYARWFEIVQRFAEPLSVHERDQLLGGTAARAYRLS